MGIIKFTPFLLNSLRFRKFRNKAFISNFKKKIILEIFKTIIQDLAFFFKSDVLSEKYLINYITNIIKKSIRADQTLNKII